MSVDYDARYRKGWAYGKAPNTFLEAAAAAHLPRGSCLDVVSLGEGQGRNVVHLASLGHRCMAVDQSSVGLAKAVALASNCGVSSLISTMQADLCRFEPGGHDGSTRWDVGNACSASTHLSLPLNCDM